MALALAVEFSPFSAKHQYFPEWVLLISKLSVFPLATVSPSLFHVIFGVGFPVALQWKVAMPDSSTVWSVGAVVILGATETNCISVCISFHLIAALRRE